MKKKKELKSKAQIKIIGPNIGEEPLLILLGNCMSMYVVKKTGMNSSKSSRVSFFLILIFLLGFVVNHRDENFFELLFSSDVIMKAKVFIFLKIALNVLLNFLLRQCLIL